MLDGGVRSGQSALIMATFFIRLVRIDWWLWSVDRCILARLINKSIKRPEVSTSFSKEKKLHHVSQMEPRASIKLSQEHKRNPAFD